jgi:ferric-dicitrate binding protein FerR (iron transport regulator)
VQRRDVSTAPEPIDWTRVARYVDDEASSDDLAHVTAVLQSDGALARDIARLRAAKQRTLMETAFPRWNRVAALAQVLQGHAASDPVPGTSSVSRGWMRQLRGATTSSSRPWLRPTLRLVTGLGLAATAFFGILGVPSWFAGRSQERAGGTRVYATQPAQRASIDLPDGSRVLLAPATTLRYIENRRGARTIELVGQAYFTVTHDPNHPFVVRTGAVETRVLGTAFDVRHYNTDDIVQVAVVTGKVSTGGAYEPLILTPGRVGRLTDSTATTVSAGDLSAITGWTRGELTFRNTPVLAVLAEVTRWSGYEFRVTDTAFVARRVTTVLLADDPSKTMTLLQDLLDVTMTVQGNVVTLHPNRKSGRVVRPAVSQELSTSTEVGK